MEDQNLPQQQKETSADQEPSPRVSPRARNTAGFRTRNQQRTETPQRVTYRTRTGQRVTQIICFRTRIPQSVSSRAKITQRVSCRARVPQKLGIRTRATDRARLKQRIGVRTRTTKRISYRGRRITERVSFRTCARQSINNRTTQKIISRYRVS